MHSLQVACDGDPSLTVLSVDGVGAFDLISRQAMLTALRDTPDANAILPFVRLFYGSPWTLRQARRSGRRGGHRQQPWRLLAASRERGGRLVKRGIGLGLGRWFRDELAPDRHAQTVVGQDDGGTLQRCQAAAVARRTCELLQDVLTKNAFAGSDGAKRVGPGSKVGCGGVRRGTAEAETSVAKRQMGPPESEVGQRVLRAAWTCGAEPSNAACCGRVPQPNHGSEGWRNGTEDVLCTGACTIKQQQPSDLEVWKSGK